MRYLIGRCSSSIALVFALAACVSDAGPAGDPGIAGQSALVKTSAEGAGDNCQNGGVRIETGVDANHNGVLDEGEADAALTSYACNGAAGVAVQTLVKTSNEAAGPNCADGGTKIEVGPDTDGNGILDAGEISAALTQYVCNGPAGVQTLIKTSAELIGSHCTYGGTKIEVGPDTDGNGSLDESEVDAALTTYACNGQAGPSSASTGLVVTITSVSNTNPVEVHFTMKDDRGYPVDRAGFYSVNTAIAPRFSLSYLSHDAAGNVLPYNVYTVSNSTSALTTFQPTFYNAVASSSSTTKTPAVGTLVEDAPGTGAYTYTFPAADVAQTKADGTPNGVLYKAVAFDTNHLNDTHTVWIQATRQTNLSNTNDPKTFTASDVAYNFIPSGVGTPIDREIVRGSNCANCHRDFKPEGLVSNQFHSGARNNPQMCSVCHNPARTRNAAAEANVFVHRIHYGEMIQTANIFHGVVATYPQDIRNCQACHGGAAQAAQITSRPTIGACGSCHDAVDFTTTTLAACTHPPALDVDGLPVPCKHSAGVQTDTACATCHKADGKIPFQEKLQHEPIGLPDPNSTYAGGKNAYTNASYLAATGYVPTGADVITHIIDSVSLVDANPVSSSYKNPQIKFKLQRNGTDVVLQTYVADTTTELMPDFVGSPSVYFAWAEPQDGITAPANYNVSASAYVKGVWNGSVAGATATLSATPDASGFYTIVLTGTKVPTAATMVTGGVGYSYSLTSTQPLTQVNLAAYPYDTTTKIGGLSVPAPNVYKVATGSTARRKIVETANCLSCHGALGAAPTFHAGQRNDAPTCSFCHTPNRTSSGWSANASHYVHAIHSGRVRTENFDWHATEEGPGYGEVEFPARINDCTACHVAGAYDLSGKDALAALPNHTPSTVAQGRYNTDPVSNPTGFFRISPYVDGSWRTNYGAGYATSKVTYKYPDGLSGTQLVGGVTVDCTADAPCLCTTANPCTQTSTVGKQGTTTCTIESPCTCVTKPATGTDNSCTVTLKTCTTLAPCEADGTTLVNSPIVEVCSACHDAPVAVDHMETNGGAFYRPRAAVLAIGAPKEQCMVCHGPGKEVAIDSVHR